MIRTENKDEIKDLYWIENKESRRRIERKARTVLRTELSWKGNNCAVFWSFFCSS